MYPHERSLVKKMEKRPFALVGVNSDTKERLLAATKRENITWPSFWDGPKPGGPIATAWTVHSWPSTFVIDAKGVIRYKNVRGQAMEDAVEALLKEMGK